MVDDLGNLVILAAVIIALFYFCLQFSPLYRLQRRVLRPIGVPGIYCLWALTTSFDKQKKLNIVRSFIETAIVASGGVHQDRKWWSGHWSDFRIGMRRYKDYFEKGITDELKPIMVDNCSALNSDGFSDTVRNYFDALRENRLYLKMTRNTKDEPLSFLVPVSISDGYLAPMSFISGLTKRFDDDWKRILVNYYATLTAEEQAGKDNRERILPSELYFSYNWLMWGPSYRVRLDNQSSHLRLILYGYGDEANSVNVIINGDDGVWEQLRRQRDTFGLHGTITGFLVDTEGFTARCRETIDEGSIPFFERLSQDSSKIQFAFRFKDFERHYVAREEETHNYFFSAYIWIMFILDRDNYEDTFSPERTITFFEHANLPNKGNYTFLIKCLINKVFQHFDTLAALDPKEKARERRYRYCISMNEDVEEAFIARLQEKQSAGEASAEWYNDHIAGEASGKFSIATILNAFDNYFVDIKVRELNYTSEEDRRKLGDFYANTYFQSCGLSAGGQSLESMLSKMRRRKTGNLCYYLIAAMDGKGTIVGILSMYCVREKPGWAVVEDLVVRDTRRGIRGALMNEARNCMERDLREYTTHWPGTILFRALCYCVTDKERKSITQRWMPDGFKPLNEATGNVWLVRNHSGDQTEEMAARHGDHHVLLCGNSNNGTSREL